MELRQLRYLLAVAEEGHFTRAAEKLFVSQSALSQQIQALEQEVGTALLDRSRRGARLTAAGEILYQHGQRVLNELEQARVAIEEIEGLKRGDLRVGVVQTVNAYFIPALAAAFTRQYPDVKLAVEELAADDIEAALEAGALQIGLSFVPPTRPNLDVEALFEERLVLVVRDDHPLAGCEVASYRQLHEMPMVMLAKSFCTRRLWEENAGLSGVQPRIMLEMNTVSSILATVHHIGLATVLPQLTLNEDTPADLVSVRLDNPTPSRQVGLLWHREHYLCAATRAFIETTRAVTERQQR